MLAFDANPSWCGTGRQSGAPRPTTESPTRWASSRAAGTSGAPWADDAHRPEAGRHQERRLDDHDRHAGGSTGRDQGASAGRRRPVRHAGNGRPPLAHGGPSEGDRRSAGHDRGEGPPEAGGREVVEQSRPPVPAEPHDAEGGPGRRVEHGVQPEDRRPDRRDQELEAGACQHGGGEGQQQVRPREPDGVQPGEGVGQGVDRFGEGEQGTHHRHRHQRHRPVPASAGDGRPHGQHGGGDPHVLEHDEVGEADETEGEAVEQLDRGRRLLGVQRSGTVSGPDRAAQELEAGEQEGRRQEHAEQGGQAESHQAASDRRRRSRAAPAARPAPRRRRPPPPPGAAPVRPAAPPVRRAPGTRRPPPPPGGGACRAPPRRHRRAPSRSTTAPRRWASPAS